MTIELADSKLAALVTRPPKRPLARPERIRGALVDARTLAYLFGVVPRTVDQWRRAGLEAAVVGTNGTPNYYDTARTADWLAGRAAAD